MKDRIIEFICAAAAVALFVAAGLIQPALDDLSIKHELTQTDNAVAQRHPELALLTIAPGGLRAPIVTYLWIRAQDMKERGRYFDAMQLASLICRLQPRFDGVWGFHAWNMAWNISVATHTPQERWLWVHNGVKLLRDEGIPLNPESLMLYRELGWIFFSKMGQTMDDMHMVYKQRWAAQMQRLLGSPPYLPKKQVIDAFRPIVEAPLDRDIRRQGGTEIQPGKLAELFADKSVAEYADKLAAHGVAVGDTLLDAYNRFSADDPAAAVRMFPPQVSGDGDQQLSDLINDSRFADQRAKMLAFTRAQLLWNRYRMDPDWMLQLMEKYGPLDWRMVWPHGLYWVSLGIHRTESLALADINSLNTDRVVLNCLKELTWSGRMTYIANPAEPDAPMIAMFSDPRFIEPTQVEHENIINVIISTTGDAFENSVLAAGHTNYLEAAIQMLVAQRRLGEAQDYWDYLKRTYKYTGGQWDMENAEDFAVYQLNAEGSPIPGVAISQITGSLQAALAELAQARRDDYLRSIRYAQGVYDIYQKNAVDRNRLPPFPDIVASVMAEMLIEPRLAGYSISMLARSRIYAGAPAQIQLAVYDRLQRYLQPQVAAAGLDFAKAFPAPDGLTEYRRRSGTEALAPLERFSE